MTDVSLRHFGRDDCVFLSRTFYPNAAGDTILAMIEEWNSLTYDGSYFEMFAVQTASGLAGRVSLHGNEENGVSLGVDILPEFRRQGIAFSAVTEALRRVKASDYTRATAMVRKDNAPSRNLFEKLTFRLVGEDISSKGREVCLYSLKL